MAKAARIAIVEAENIVPVGSIEPDVVDLPGIFIDRIVPATTPKNFEVLKLAQSSDSGEPVKLDSRNRIAKRAAAELKDGFYVNLGVGIPTLAAPPLPLGLWCLAAERRLR